ncbi:MAG: 23S rRNA (uracil(1939)-C(5))-methyltransferase RlmD [Thermaerobacter sp.]|nr:23S rRNA (uracil(1939)-C(5))-methyltransferase RlmD [Thermaerobacter sp.]
MQAEIEITGIGRSGEGVGRHEGLVLFVPGAVPGDLCLVTYTQDRKQMARARLLRIVRPSADRVAPPCAVFGRCGGCQLQAISYPAELREKTRTVQDALRRIGRLDADVAPCIGPEDPYAYRAKVSWPVRKQNGVARIGLFAAQSHEIVEQDDCSVAAPSLRLLPEILRRAMAELGISAYDGQGGILRHAVARRARSGDILLTLVATSDEARLAALAERVMTQDPDVVGVAVSLNEDPGNRIFGGPARLLAGRGEITEEILGLRFSIGPTSFFQVHPGAAEHLFAKALEFAGSAGGETALDLYTGVGVLALLLAREGYDTFGVEYAPDAVALARRNAERNGLRATFSVGDAQKAPLPRGVGLLTLDPPRGGAPELARRLAAEGPARIVYVSCDPATLARDARVLADGGYRLGRVQPIDLFPRTVHVETVAEFVR